MLLTQKVLKNILDAYSSDFSKHAENKMIPIEVKSDENVRGKSLALYNKLYNSPIRVRYSLKNITFDNGLINIPFFLSDYTKKIISIAFNQ